MCRTAATSAIASGGCSAVASNSSSSCGAVANHADALPQETTLHLLEFLDAVSLSKCAETYSAWRKLASTDLLWHRRCQSEFGIDGGKADYASRWRQEKQRSLANLTLYIAFLDEIYFSLAGFFALVSICVVFPALVVLKIDGWLAVSWTQVFGCIYSLGFVAVMFLLVRITLFATVFSSTSTLKSCMTYCGVVQIAKRTVANQDVARKMAALTLASCILGAVPFMIHLFVDGYLATLRLAALLLWTSTAVVTQQIRRISKSKRSAAFEMTSKCAFLVSSLLLAKATFASRLPWCTAVLPFIVPPAIAGMPIALQHVAFKRVCGRFGASYTTSRRPSSTEASSYAAFYYQHCPPLMSLALSALKLDGALSGLPWALVMMDYAAWAVHGPLALHARQLVQVMFRDMPIPATLRKL